MASYPALALLSVLLLLASQASWGQQGGCHLTDIVITQRLEGCNNATEKRCEYVVEIIDISPPGAPGSAKVHDVHVSCGDFVSTPPVNPKVFRRLQPGDCLVLDGRPMVPGQYLAFGYTTNGTQYPLKVSSLKCL